MPAQLSEAVQAHHPGELSTYYTNRHPGGYLSSGANGKHGYAWPHCMGECVAGVCELDQSRPGCCYLQERDGAPEDEDLSAEVAGGGSPAGAGYRERSGSELVCWRDEDDTPHIVYKTAATTGYR
jgi:hypothetical protein